MPVINKSPQAFVDLDELASYIQRDNPDAAYRFLISAEWTFNLLYVRRPFRNYKIFYQAIESGIFVVRILHSSRDVPAQLDH